MRAQPVIGWAALGLAVLALESACIFPSDDQGRTHNAGFGGSSVETYDAPQVTGFSPSSGPYGTEVTITGKGLGSRRDGVELVLGGQGKVVVTPSDASFVEGWGEERIRFRFPFPAEGVVSIETPEGAAVAGDFSPSWSPGPGAEVGPTASIIASISPSAGEIAVVLDTTPPTLIHFQAEAATQSPIEISGHRPETLRLYLSSLGELEGFALSASSPPEILHLVNQAGTLTAVSTGVTVSDEFAVGGGVAGAAVWYRDGDDWTRVRPGESGWAIDKGPIADPTPTAPDHAAAATSDGTLWIAYSQDSGTFADDMERPACRALAPDATTFASAVPCGSNIDDYITSLAIESRGAGLLIHYCGSDVDPFGLSETDYICRDSAITTGGAVELKLPREESLSTRYAFTTALISSANCSQDGLDLSANVSLVDAKETALWPCPEILALELDASGDFSYVVRWDDTLYAPTRRK